MGLTVQRVSSAGSRKEFLTLPWKIYKDDPLWVPPLLPKVKKTISPETGAFFKRGTADFFVAYLDGVPVGRICAADDPPTNDRRGRADCMIGFYECIDNRDVSRALFERAAEWGLGRGLDHLFGPFNLDYENSYGVLVSGRDRPPALMCGHTPPYYLDQFQSFGFEKARGDNLAFRAEIDPDSPGQKRLSRLARIARKRGDFTIRPVRLDELESEIDRVHNLLIHSLAHLEGSVPWRRDSLKATFMPLKDIVDPDLILFAERNGETIGWFPGIPNLNEIFIRLNGLRWPWNYIGLIGGLKRKTKCIAAKSLLVLPEYWNTGVVALLFDEMAKRAYERGYEWADLSLTAEDNPQTPVIADSLGAVEYKRYRVFYKKLIS